MPPQQHPLLLQALQHVQKIFKGNGIKSSTIAIVEGKIEHHSLNASTFMELRPVINERDVPGKVLVGRPVANKDEAQKLCDQAMRKAASDTAIHARITELLLGRSDQGFGLQQTAIPIPFIKEEYSWPESCHSCHGNGKAVCQRCQGRRVETCTRCKGRGMMPCPTCRMTGMLQGVKCNRCHGQRYVACDGCRHSGMMSCQGCQATGQTNCQTCGGQGWKTHVLSLAAQGVTYFEYDAKSVPKGAADIIETQGAWLAQQGVIKIDGQMVDTKENSLGASYTVTFPYGDITFQIGKREAKAHIFGYKGRLTEFPHLLDKILSNPVEDLESASTDRGDVANQIRKATRYRLIAQAYLGVMKRREDYVVKSLLKIYDIGLGEVMAEKIVHLARTTLSHITKKPRSFGLAYGVLATVAMMAAYYLLPVRSSIASVLPDQRLDFVLDILPIVLSGFISTNIVRLQAVSAVRTALGHLIKNKADNDKLIPPAGHFAWIGYVIAAVIAIIVIEITRETGGSVPYWYKAIVDMVAQ